MENTPKLWDNLWETDISEEEDRFALAKEEKSIRWERIENVVLKEFGSFKDLNILEIGAGAGTNSVLMAKKGARVTILDYSEQALQRSQELFRRNQLNAEFTFQDALALPNELLNKYDVSMSFGLTEHFLGADRVNINKAHFQVLREGGISFISVPNKYNLPYRISKYFSQLLGRWKVGMEIPYSRRELRNICQEIGVTEISFFGDSLISSMQFVSPIRIIKKLLKIKEPPGNIQSIPKEKGTFLDAYLSYAIVFVGKRTAKTNF